MTVQAINIHVSPSTQKLKADTDVQTIIKPKKAAARTRSGWARRGAGRTGARRTCPPC